MMLTTAVCMMCIVAAQPDLKKNGFSRFLLSHHLFLLLIGFFFIGMKRNLSMRLPYFHIHVEKSDISIQQKDIQLINYLLFEKLNFIVFYLQKRRVRLRSID